MAVHIDRIVSDVVAAPEPHPPAPAGTSPAATPEGIDRSALARLARDAARTAAEGFDD